MRGFQRPALPAALFAACLAAGCATPDSSPSRDESVSYAVGTNEIRGERRKQSDGFSNITLQTQFGDRVEFYEDLIRDKAVIVNFFYTTCAKTCPGTSAQLAKMNDDLAQWMGEEITMLSLSIDPEVDTPERMKEYWEVFGSKPGWLMLTGDEDEINRVRRQMGVYDLDPVIDADKTEHAGIVTFGNDRTDRWAALPVFMHRERMVETILHTTRDREWQSARQRARRSPASTRGTFTGRGVVRALYPERNQVLIEHESIPGLMMAMTMVFSVEDPELLASLQSGERVEFELQVVGNEYRIVAVSVSGGGPPEDRSARRRTHPTL